jgi:VWFA-related protein
MPAINENTRRRRLLASLLIALLPCLALAQQPTTQKPTESDEVLRVSTEIVQTDVSVFDKSGKFVDNLKPDQFLLKVDGRPQPVSFFERVVAGSVNEDTQIAAARGASRADGAAATAVPLDRGRAIIFFIDDLHLSPSSLVHTRQLLLHFIDTQLRQNDQMAITTATNQLGFLSQLTDDKRVLREAVSRLSVRVAADIVDREQPWMNVAQALAIERREMDITDAFISQTMKENPTMTEEQAHNHIVQRADQLIDQNSAVVLRTFDSLRAVLHTFAEFPGRKLFYFASDGFALDFQRNNTYDRVRQLTDAAVRAGAVIYTFDARGLGAQLLDLPRADDGSSFDPANRFNGATINLAATTQEPLRTIADETGGRAILNTDSIAQGVERALKDTSVYYLLAWKPEHEENRGGKFQRVEVSVKDRPELTVLVQRGFYSTPPDAASGNANQKNSAAKNSAADGANAQSPEQAARAKELFAALRSPFPRATLPTSLTLNYTKSQDAKLVLSMSLQVEFEPSKATEGAPPTTDHAEVIGALYDDHGKVVNTFDRTANVTPKSVSVEIPKTVQLTFAFQSQVTPGLYQARFASLDPKSHRTGSVSQWIDVPDVNGKGFTMSSVFLGVRPPVATPEDKQADAAGPQVLVVPDRRFPRDARARFLIYAYNAASGADGKPDIAVQVQVFRDDQPVITAPLRKLNAEGFTDFSRLPYAAEVSLAGVPAGRYLLRLTAIDRVAKASASQSIKFTID